MVWQTVVDGRTTATPKDAKRQTVICFFDTKKGKTVHLQPPVIFDFFNQSPEFRLLKFMSFCNLYFTF